MDRLIDCKESEIENGLCASGALDFLKNFYSLSDTDKAELLRESPYFRHHAVIEEKTLE